MEDNYFERLVGVRAHLRSKRLWKQTQIKALNGLTVARKARRAGSSEEAPLMLRHVVSYGIPISFTVSNFRRLLCSIQLRKPTKS